MARMEWLDKKVKEVRRQWRANEITAQQAVWRFVSLGFSMEAAWRELER